MKKVIIDSSAAAGIGVGGSLIQTQIPPAVDAVTTYTHAIVTIATVIGTLWPVLSSLFKKKSK